MRLGGGSGGGRKVSYGFVPITIPILVRDEFACLDALVGPCGKIA
jgi:hypothetical protein